MAGIPYEWIGTGLGALAGAGQRIFRMGGESRALTQQLREARKLLAENPHNDQYVRSVTNLTSRRTAARKDLLSWKNAGLVARDTGIGGGIGFIGGMGARFIMKRPTLSAIAGDMAVEQLRAQVVKQPGAAAAAEKATEAVERAAVNTSDHTDDIISSGGTKQGTKKTKPDPVSPEKPTGSGSAPEKKKAAKNKHATTDNAESVTAKGQS